MAGPGPGPAATESDRPVRQERITMESRQSRLTLVRPVYLTGILQLLLALAVGVVGMLAASRDCTLSITWVYFFHSLWFIVASSVGLSSTRRGAVACSLGYIKRSMKWYRMMCAVGVLMIFGFMTLELIGLLQESEPTESEGWSCLTMHLVILSVGFVSVLVTMIGILTSTKVIIILHRVQRQRERNSFSAQSNTVSGLVGHINFGMTPDITLPAYSVDADLPPTYEDVISGKADGVERPASNSLDEGPSRT